MILRTEVDGAKDISEPDGGGGEGEMKGKPKALGLAVMMSVALTALFAEAAQATEYWFHAHSPTARNVITAENEDVHRFRITEDETEEAIVTVECGVMKARGDVTGTLHENKLEAKTYTASGITVGVEYSECGSSLGPVTVVTTDCHYLLTSNTAEFHGAVHIECGAGGIEIKSNLGCVVTIPTQTPEYGVHYETLGSETPEHTVTGSATVRGITYKSNATCQLAGIPKEGSNADYDGKFVAAGYEYESGETKTGYVEGEQVSTWWGPTE
jgi:hypothetical protein